MWLQLFEICIKKNPHTHTYTYTFAPASTVMKLFMNDMPATTLLLERQQSSVSFKYQNFTHQKTAKQLGNRSFVDHLGYRKTKRLSRGRNWAILQPNNGSISRTVTDNGNCMRGCNEPNSNLLPAAGHLQQFNKFQLTTQRNARITQQKEVISIRRLPGLKSRRVGDSNE